LTRNTSTSLLGGFCSPPAFGVSQPSGLPPACGWRSPKPPAIPSGLNPPPRSSAPRPLGSPRGPTRPAIGSNPSCGPEPPPNPGGPPPPPRGGPGMSPRPLGSSRRSNRSSPRPKSSSNRGLAPLRSSRIASRPPRDQSSRSRLPPGPRSSAPGADARVGRLSASERSTRSPPIIVRCSARIASCPKSQRALCVKHSGGRPRCQAVRAQQAVPSQKRCHPQQGPQVIKNKPGHSVGLRTARSQRSGARLEARQDARTC
jgi:hypothetical protein